MYMGAAGRRLPPGAAKGQGGKALQGGRALWGNQELCRLLLTHVGLKVVKTLAPLFQCCNDLAIGRLYTILLHRHCAAG